MEQHIKRCVVYDFDNTICISPENTDENRRLWESKTGSPWKHKGNGWWSKPETLDYTVFDIQLNKHVKENVLKDLLDPETYTVLLTGRLPRFSSTIKEICRLGGLEYFDAYYFNDISDTLKFKLSILDKLKNEFPNITYFEMWEDRVDHIPYFIEWGEKNYGKNFNINIVE